MADMKQPKKEDLTCPFHSDVEGCLKKLDKRTFWILLLLGLNLMASGFYDGWKIVSALIH